MASETGRLIVGLGNPGPRYAANRHNIGFMAVSALARARGLAFAPGAGRWLEARDPQQGLVLLLPLTYMNLSGEAVVGWSRAAGVPVTGRPRPAPPDAPAGSGTAAEAPPCTEPPPAALRPLLVCDDLALPLGALRLRARGSSGGQNGLESVIRELGGEEFPRLRLGIAPTEAEVAPAGWADFVLEDFTAAETGAVAEVLERAVAALECWLADGLEAAASRHNRRRPPPPTPVD